jgi:hypothetical protein
VKKILVILCLAVALLASCGKKSDPVVAQVYEYKLYASEIQAFLPHGLSQNDSAALVRDYIDNWIKEKLVLHEAEKNLTPKEKNFEKEMQSYRNSLLMSRYYDKLWMKDTANVQISDREISDFAHSLDNRYTVEKEIVRVNYVKIPTKAPTLESVKKILFDENLRKENKETLVQLLGDSIEYLLDDDAWLYLDDLQNEVAFEIDAEKVANNKGAQRIEKTVGDNTILLVILDYRSQRSVNETKEERAAAQMLLMNQRKTQFINQYIQDLYDKAVKEGVVVQ